MPAAQRDAGHELVMVQCLRGLAAMMVVLYHCFPQLERMGYRGNHFQSLSAGVDVFFIISGFIMLYSAHRAPQRGSGPFLLNRAIRILPVYWLLTSVMVVVALAAPQLMGSTKFDAHHVAFSYLMLPAEHPVHHQYWPILVPGWTLNYEMFFYAIFALGLFLMRDRGARLVAFTAAIIALLVLVPALYPLGGVAAFYTGSVMIEFVYGLLAGLAYLRGWRIDSTTGIVCIAAGFALLLWSDFAPHPDIRGLIYGLPALLIFVGAVFPRFSPSAESWRLPRLLGDASYSIYLTNMIAMAAVGLAWRKLLGGSLPGNTVWFILFAVPVCTAGGIVLYCLVEEPVTRRLKSLSGSNAKRSAVATAS